jgi:DNA-binding cell septation regulator SpoVG
VLAFRPAPALDRELGLLGWVGVLLDDAIRIENIVIRRTRDGRLRLFYPERRDARGCVHRDVWPVSLRSRRHIEREVLRQLERRRDLRREALAS